METTLLLNDEARPGKLMLENIAPIKVTPRETEPVAGCNCDRWGHPCAGCAERIAQRRAEQNRTTTPRGV